METVLEDQTRIADLSRLPYEIKHWDKRSAQLDKTLLVLFLRKPMDREAMEKALEKTGLQLVKAPTRGISLQARDFKPGPKQEDVLIPQETPLLNECNTLYFVESEAGKPIAEANLGRLEKYLDKKAGSIGPIYRLGQDDKGRKRFDIRFCPFPRTLLVELKPGVNPKSLDTVLKPEYLEIDWNFHHPKLFCLRFTGPATENVYELKNRLVEKHPSLILFAHFENMPMLNPQQGSQWNHQRIQSTALGAFAGGNPTPVAIIDRGVQFNNQFSAIPNGGSWNAGTLAAPPPTYTVSDYHGTCCAGIVSEVSRTFAVIPNPTDYPILSLIAPNFTDSQIASAINFAADNGYKVISMSLAEENGIWRQETIGPALQNAETRGCTVCVSSGNSNQSSLPYPANVSSVIAVGATNRDDSRVSLPTWGSNYGANLSVCAPGVDIATNDLNGIAGISNFTGLAGAFTMVFSGTSASTPHVAAVAAMIISKCKSLSIPPPTTAKIKQRIQSTADKVSPGNPYPGGVSNTHGFGRLNAANALSFNAATF